MSAATVTETNTNNKESNMKELENKVDNLFKHARVVCTKEDFAKTVKTVVYGIGHLLQLAYYAGISLIGLIVEYVAKFINWLKSKFDAAKVNFAKKHLADAVK
jgi:hypothetical protein